MKLLYFLLLPVLLKSNFEWAVIGAGPAGITTVGTLLDLGIPAEKIAWIDPEFKAGRLPTYAGVPSNNPTSKFFWYIKNCQTFNNCNSKEINDFFKLNPDGHYKLKNINQVLFCLTSHLKKRVNIFESRMHYLFPKDNWWNILTTSQELIKTKNVVLATGSEPKKLSLHKPGTMIPLDVALNENQLAHVVNEDDTVAVIGSAHSAILIAKYLSELNVKMVYNFYNKELILKSVINPTLDLYGVAAKWVKDVLLVNPPANIKRIQSDEQNLQKYLPTCTKVVYAIGYQPNHLPEAIVDLLQSNDDGVIAPGLFGIGIAYPESYMHENIGIEPQVGLKAFLDYAQQKMPIWMNQKR